MVALLGQPTPPLARGQALLTDSACSTALVLHGTRQGGGDTSCTKIVLVHCHITCNLISSLENFLCHVSASVQKLVPACLQLFPSSLFFVLGFITFIPDYFHDLFHNSALQNLSELIKSGVILGRNGWLGQMLVKETVLYWLYC